MPWMTVRLSDDQVASGLEMDLSAQVDKAFAAASCPDDAGMFEYRQQDRDERDVTIFYFTPAAASVLAGLLPRWGAMEIEPPELSDLTISVGPPLSAKRALDKA